MKTYSIDEIAADISGWLWNEELKDKNKNDIKFLLEMKCREVAIAVREECAEIALADSDYLIKSLNIDDFIK